MPADTRFLMTTPFSNVEQPVLAEYCRGAGLVIASLEFYGHQPAGTGESYLLRNLIDYARNNPQQRICGLPAVMTSSREKCRTQ